MKPNRKIKKFGSMVDQYNEKLMRLHELREATAELEAFVMNELEKVTLNEDFIKAKRSLDEAKKSLKEADKDFRDYVVKVYKRTTLTNLPLNVRVQLRENFEIDQEHYYDLIEWVKENMPPETIQYFEPSIDMEALVAYAKATEGTEHAVPYLKKVFTPVAIIPKKLPLEENEYDYEPTDA